MYIFLGKKVLLCKAVTFYCTKIFTVFRMHQIPRKAYKSDQSGQMLCTLKFYMDTRCVEMAQQQESGPTGTKIHTQEVLTENIVRQRLCTRKGTHVSEIFATAKQGVYPKGDTFRGILELQIEAAVLELMVFGKLKKGNGSAGAVFLKYTNNRKKCYPIIEILTKW